jgi:hypothetical protein
VIHPRKKHLRDASADLRADMEPEPYRLPFAGLDKGFQWLGALMTVFFVGVLYPTCDVYITAVCGALSGFAFYVLISAQWFKTLAWRQIARTIRPVDEGETS